MLELMFLEAGCLRLDFQRCSLRGSVNKTRAEDGNVPLSSATALAIGPHRKRDVVAGATAQRGSWPHAPEGLGLNLAISA